MRARRSCRQVGEAGEVNVEARACDHVIDLETRPGRTLEQQLHAATARLDSPHMSLAPLSRPRPRRGAFSHQAPSGPSTVRAFSTRTFSGSMRKAAGEFQSGHFHPSQSLLFRSRVPAGSAVPPAYPRPGSPGTAPQVAPRTRLHAAGRPSPVPTSPRPRWPHGGP